MKRRTGIFLLGLLALSLCATTSDAQLFRKKKKPVKKATYIPRDAVKRPTAAKTPPPPKKKEFQYPPTVMKDRYRVDLLAPFYLGELVQDNKVKGKLPDKVMASLKFYEGVTLAVDTLKKMGYRFDVYVYDVADELENPATLVNTDAFKGSDLVLGVLSSGDFPMVSKYANRNNINFVSALSPSSQGVTDNPYFTMLQPTLETHCQAIEAFIYKKHGNISPLMMYRTSVSVDKNAMGYFTKDNAIEYKLLTVDEMPTKVMIQPYLFKERKNVVVMPILSDAYAEQLIVKLYEWFPEYEFEVWGMPSWDNMPSLKRSDAYPNVAVYFTNPFYFDQNTPAGQNVLRAYRSKYGGKADNMVFRGYETMFWYAYLLKKYGTIFNINLWDNGGAIFTKYDIKPALDAEKKIMYNENKHLYLFRYQSSSYMVEQ